jgi:hypothetical protein
MSTSLIYKCDYCLKSEEFSTFLISKMYYTQYGSKNNFEYEFCKECSAHIYEKIKKILMEKK